jgi:hypothetical protein
MSLSGVTTLQPYPLSSSRLSDIANFISTLANTATENILRFQASNTGMFPPQLPGISGSAPSSQPVAIASAPAAGGALMQASNWLLVGGVALLIIAGIVWVAKR